ncbi:MAG: response regulator [Deltaproteobacteria bacterium]|nr:response regulator [Deltaproteobacteria bacterium]
MGTKILTVDDSRVMLRIISSAIERLGYQPVIAKNGAVALELLEEQGEEIALVLLDWNMPVMNGLDTLKAIRAQERFQDLPVMMVTTESERTNVLEAIRAGARHYLTKPFSPEDLVIRMMECLGLGDQL